MTLIPPTPRGRQAPRATKTAYADATPYVTKDGSVIRELAHPGAPGGGRQSLAEATVAPGGATLPHRHRRSEEIYHVVAGSGRMTLGMEQFAITAGDTVLIPPGTRHCVAALGDGPLRILCCCSPAYAHDDTEILAAL